MNHTVGKGMTGELHVLDVTRCEGCGQGPGAISGTPGSRSLRITEDLVGWAGHCRCTCVQCNTSFTQSGTRKGHMLQHTGDKPYICDKCNKNSAQCSTLKDHMLLHIGDKPTVVTSAMNPYFRDEPDGAKLDSSLTQIGRASCRERV